MKRVEAIRTNEKYIACYHKNIVLERDRVFCCHEMDHFLDVARIAYIQNLEQNLGLEKDVIYAVALLHDIGRWKQYEDGTPHDEASAQIAEEIFTELPEAVSFSVEEQKMILGAILGHRMKKSEGNQNICNQKSVKLQEQSNQIEEGQKQSRADVLRTLLYKSDKMSRKCYICSAEKACNWSLDKKNMAIEI